MISRLTAIFTLTAVLAGTAHAQTAAELLNDGKNPDNITTQGMVPTGGSVDEFNKQMRGERAFYERLVKETGIKLGQ